MSWIFYAILAPAIWGAVNHIDKYIISKYFSGVGGVPLVLFTSLTAGIGAIIIPFFVNVSSITLYQAILIIIAGMVFVASYIPYVLAMQEDEASIVAPLFQMIFVFSYVFGFIFLDEKLGILQIIAGLLVILGSVILSIDLSVSSFKIRFKTFFRMALASALVAVNMTIFKIVAIESSFAATLFWEYIGAFLFGVILLCLFKNYRNNFLSVWTRNSKSVVSWNVFNEALNLVARMSASFASLFVPIALVSIVNGTQPFFIMIYAVLIPLIWKSQIRENFHGKYLVQKVVACTIMFVGVYILFK